MDAQAHVSVALVTGGSSLGPSLTRALAWAFADPDAEKANAGAVSLGTARGVEIGVRHEGSVEALVDDVVITEGSFHVGMVNCGESATPAARSTTRPPIGNTSLTDASWVHFSW